MQVTALKPMVYAGRRIAVGDSFEASDRDARTLVAIGKARLADESPRRRYRRRDMQAER